MSEAPCFGETSANCGMWTPIERQVDVNKTIANPDVASGLTKCKICGLSQPYTVKTDVCLGCLKKKQSYQAKPDESEFPPEKDKCETCEHNNDSGTEYCGTCTGGVKSNWKEASWIKSDKIAKLETEIARLNSELEACRDANTQKKKEIVRLNEALSDIATGKHPQKRCVEIAERGLNQKEE